MANWPASLRFRFHTALRLDSRGHSRDTCWPSGLRDPAAPSTDRRPYIPTVADVEPLAKTLGSILAGKPQSHGALTVIPILAPMQAEPEWLTRWVEKGR